MLSSKALLASIYCFPISLHQIMVLKQTDLQEALWQNSFTDIEHSGVLLRFHNNKKIN